MGPAGRWRPRGSEPWHLLYGRPEAVALGTQGRRSEPLKGHRFRLCDCGTPRRNQEAQREEVDVRLSAQSNQPPVIFWVRSLTCNISLLPRHIPFQSVVLLNRLLERNNHMTKWFV